MTETDDKILMQLGTARHALAAARSIGDFKKIADVAALAERYAKRVKLSQETADFALEIRLRAERGLGEVLARTPKHKGSLKRSPTLPEGNHRESSTLAELGIVGCKNSVPFARRVVKFEIWPRRPAQASQITTATTAITAVKLTGGPSSSRAATR